MINFSRETKLKYLNKCLMLFLLASLMELVSFGPNYARYLEIYKISVDVLYSMIY